MAKATASRARLGLYNLWTTEGENEFTVTEIVTCLTCNGVLKPQYLSGL